MDRPKTELKDPKIWILILCKAQRWDRNCPSYRCATVEKCFDKTLNSVFWQMNIIIKNKLRILKILAKIAKLLFQENFLLNRRYNTPISEQKKCVSSLYVRTTCKAWTKIPNRHIFCHFLMKEKKLRIDFSNNKLKISKNSRFKNSPTPFHLKMWNQWDYRYQFCHIFSTNW